MASNGEAVGLLETRGLVCHIVATDAMCKAAEVEIITQVQIGGAYITTLIHGDVGSVRAAVDAGAQVASKEENEKRRCSASVASETWLSLVDLRIRTSDISGGALGHWRRSQYCQWPNRFWLSSHLPRR